jgi:hypothetical protein
MTNRKGEITRSDLLRRWRHHVALPHKAGRGISESAAICAFAETLSISPRSYILTNDDGLARAEDAVVFCEEFGGELLPVPRGTTPLWGVGQRMFFLHDGRTSDLLQAIQAHFSTSTPLPNPSQYRPRGPPAWRAPKRTA